MPFMAYISPWRIVIRHPGRTTPWSEGRPHKFLVCPILLLLLLSALTGCTVAEDPRWRRSAGLSHEQRFVTTNGLDQEIHSTHDHKYQLLLDELSGDFGIKSEVVAAAFKEPEYRGADTVVVPLYIPRGAIPIRLARIARSGSPDVFPLDDLKVSASDDSLLLRRVGLPHQGRRIPPSRLMHPPWRSRSDLKEKTKQSDHHTSKNIRTPPPPSPTPSISIRGYGQRIKNSGNSRIQEKVSTNLEEEIDQDATKRTKKNELSKDSQFPGELSTTEPPIIQTTTTKHSSFNSTKSSEKTGSTKPNATKSKSLVSSIESAPSDIEDIKSPSKISTETTFTRSHTTLATDKEISSTTEASVDIFSSTFASMTSIKTPINSSVLPSLFDNVTYIATTTPRTLKRIPLFKPELNTRKITISNETENKTAFERNSSSKERTEHRSVLFPRPVEAILNIGQSSFSTSTPSTTTLTTTEIYSNTTIATSRFPTRNKTRLRSRLSRIKSSSTSSSTTTPPSTSSSSTTTTSTSTTTTTTTPAPTTTTTTTTTTPAEITTRKPITTISPLRKVTIPRLSATTKKLQLITQKPPAFPLKFVTPNLSLNSTIQQRARVKATFNREKISSGPAANFRKEIRLFNEVNTSTKSPQITTEKILRLRTQNITKASDDPETDSVKVQPITLITLKENDKKDVQDESVNINLSHISKESEEVSLTQPTFTGISTQEHSIRPNGRRVRKPNGRIVNGRPVRRRRPFRHSTTSPAPSSAFNTSDLLSVFSTKTTLSPVTEIPHKSFTTRPHKTITSSSESTTIRSKSIEESIVKEEKILRTPSKGLTFKSHEQVVLESLSEIMRDATNHSKDRVSNIASDLEALNKRLAERNIFIINAEVDGVKIKLKETYTFQATSNSNSSFNPPIPTRKSTIITRQPSASTNIRDVLKPTTSRENVDISLSPLRVMPVNEESEKQMQTSVRSSFSMHTSKTTDIEDGSDNEVRSTTLNSYLTTPKSLDSQKDDIEHVRSDFTFNPTSIVSSIENTNGDSVESNASDTLFRSVNKNQTQPIKTFITADRPEIDSPDESSIFISATTTVPASVTTRTRSTTVPINPHRPTLRPLMVKHKDRYKSVDDGNNDDDEEFSDEYLNISPENDSKEDQSSGLDAYSKLHPTSHLRPTEENSHPDSTSSNTGTPFFSIEEVKTDPADLQRTAVEIIDKDSIPEAKTSTTVYIVAVIGIIPGAVAIAFFVRRYLNKDEKSLPDAEEQAEGFTPVTQHSRKHSQSNPLPIAHDSPGSRTSEEIPSPPYTKTPWEFPRSKLRLVSILGEGNFGVVWKAEARDLCGCGENGTGGPTVLVAVKSVKDGAGLKEREDLIKELDIMQHLGQHPNVVTLLGCCTQTEPHLVIMEYVMFGKLLTFLRDVRTRHKYYNFSADNEALTSKDLTRFACDVASGCEYLQSRGIIHRDLAARNILVDHNKVCKIADFGLARSVKDLGSDIYEQKSRGALPIRWMAPESLYMSIFTHKSDVWSFGILCWEIVTLGSTPYPGMTAREVMRRVREGYRLDRPEHCRSELYLIVTKCWHQDLNKRPSFSDIKLELAQLLDHQMGYVDLENFPEASYYSMHANNEEKL